MTWLVLVACLAIAGAFVFTLSLCNVAQHYPLTRCNCGEMMNRHGYCDKCGRAIE